MPMTSVCMGYVSIHSFRMAEEATSTVHSFKKTKKTRTVNVVVSGKLEQCCLWVRK